ncbi:hypothetical protein O181_071208 [Austropuccinia psidii MF-1]|uniref:Uncharacterized protein n=1 Tax=Austropuccinia psidii MF-1 TaxID=1389203 RepID=A0A9Q3F572_9BASI|nr:hypothetical protein [Austropuccinia psidii MF-1]
MAHLWWHATVRLTRIPRHHTQILTPVQDPNASHAKPCTINPYAGAAFQKYQKIPYACPGSQCFTCKIRTLVQVPHISKDSPPWGSLPKAWTIPYVGAGFQHFTRKSLRLGRFPKIQTISYAREGF